MNDEQLNTVHVHAKPDEVVTVEVPPGRNRVVLDYNGAGEVVWYTPDDWPGHSMRFELKAAGVG